MKKVYVIGTGMTKFGKLEQSGRELAIEAAKEAIQESGIASRDIESTYVSNAFGIGENQLHIGPIINSALGIPEVPSLSIESACSGGSAAFSQA